MSELLDVLEQGDVVDSAPFSSVPGPPVNLISTSLKGGVRGWAEHPSPKLDGNKHGNFLAKGPFELGMVLNHGCDIDKPSNKYVLVIPLKVLATLPADHQDVVRQQSSIPLLFLPDVPSVGDCVADLRLMTRVPTSVVMECNRLASMSDFARQRLGAQLMLFFTRKALPSAAA